MYSPLHNIAFVHIHKTAGSSIEAALDIEERRNTGTGGALGGPLKHETAELMRSRIGDAAWRRAFRFTVVRNPWARIHSYWYAVARKRGAADFPAWVRRRFRHCRASRMQCWSLPVRCWLWTASARAPDVHTTIKFESLQCGWEHVLRRACIPFRPLPHILDRLRTWRPDYRESYDDASRRLIRDVYDEEIRAFGYTFSNGVHPAR